MAPPKDSQDVTLASADPDLVLCWEHKVKQGKECSLLLEFKNGNVITTLKVSKSKNFEDKTQKSWLQTSSWEEEQEEEETWYS